jgi:hypothetical protein
MNGATRTIWKTVVFAGAMLGSAACGGKKAPATTPAETKAVDDATTTDEAAPDEASTDPCSGDPADPCADPCGGRPRGVSDEGDTGRGFILS